MSKQYKEVSEEEKPMRHHIRRKKLMIALSRKAQETERARKCAAFIANLFGFTKQLLGNVVVILHVLGKKKKVDHFLHSTLSNPDRQ